MKNTDSYHYTCKGSHHMQPPNWHFSISAKLNWTQRKTLVSPWRMHCAYCGMSKGMQWNWTVNKIKLIALAFIKLCLSEGISQAVRQPVRHMDVKIVNFVCLTHSLTTVARLGTKWSSAWPKFYDTRINSLVRCTFWGSDECAPSAPWQCFKFPIKLFFFKQRNHINMLISPINAFLAQHI